MMYKIDKKHLEGVEKVLYLEVLRKIVELNLNAHQCIIPLADLLVTAAILGGIPKKDFLVFADDLFVAIEKAGEANGSPINFAAAVNSKGSKDAN